MEINAVDAAIRLLNYSDRTESQIRDRLKKSKFEDTEIEDAVSFLYECGYLDDARYAENYIIQCRDAGKGSYLVRKRLEERGVKRDIAETMMEIYYDRESEVEICYKKAVRLLGIPENKQYVKPERSALEKTGRRLSASGFPTSCIFDAFRRIGSGY